MSDQPPKKRIAIEIPADVPTAYSNMAFISGTPSEVVLDFAQVLPRTPKGKVKARIIMSPVHAKMLQMALTQNIANHEAKFGEIRLPHSANLADQLFRFPPGDDDEKE